MTGIGVASDDVFAAERDRLFAIAYRMLARVSDDGGEPPLPGRARKRAPPP
jgi:hypothetical protein